MTRWTEEQLRDFVARGQRAQQTVDGRGVLVCDRRSSIVIAERVWQGQVEKLLDLFRWSHYHTHDSRRSAEGFPDLVACRPPRLIFVELKRDGKEPTPAQWTWLDAFSQCGAECYVWRPADIEEVRKVLR